MLGPWIKVNGQAGAGKRKYQHLTNHWTKIDENGWI